MLKENIKAIRKIKGTFTTRACCQAEHRATDSF